MPFLIKFIKNVFSKIKYQKISLKTEISYSLVDLCE